MVESGQLSKTQDLRPSAVGVSFKSQHYQSILEASSLPPFFEIISENFMNTNGFPLHILKEISSRCPFTMHGVSLSIGSDKKNRHNYLSELKKLVDLINPAIVSDHLCWTGWGDHTSHDLLPLPLTEESLRVVAATVHKIQEHLGRVFTLENISQYVRFEQNDHSEIEFLKELNKRTDCTFLLDVNNVYVNSKNFKFDAKKYINDFPREHVVQYHLAGHSVRGDYLYDTHVGPVPNEVIDLFRYTLEIIGPKPSILEWDSEVPSYEDLILEGLRLAKVVNHAAREHSKELPKYDFQGLPRKGQPSSPADHIQRTP